MEVVVEVLKAGLVEVGVGFADAEVVFVGCLVWEARGEVERWGPRGRRRIEGEGGVDGGNASGRSGSWGD